MKILVTGGTGFIGKALVLRLHDLGYDVQSLALDESSELKALNILQFKGSLTDTVLVEEAVSGCQAIFHTAARTGISGSRRDFWDSNVSGTEQILSSAEKNGVEYLIYTGSPSAVFNHRAIEGLSERECTYPKRFLSFYEETKAEAEKMVCAIGRLQGKLKTLSIRPHLVYGPGDTNLLPRLIQRASRGKLVQIGTGKNRVDLTYIDNAVQGHIAALLSLEKKPSLSGNVYFISDGAPVELWPWIRNFLEKLDIAPPERALSLRSARAAGAVFEIIWRVFRIYRKEPPMTRFLAEQLALSHHYNINKACTELGFKPEAPEMEKVILSQGLNLN